MNFSSGEYEIIRSRRSTIAIHILPNGNVQVRAPFLMPVFLIERFVALKQDWIQDVKTRMTNTPVHRLMDGDSVPFLGKPLHIQNTPSHTILRVGDILCVPHAYHMHIRQHLELWYRKEAKKVLTQKTAFFAQKIGASYSAVSIRDTTSRWGSCSSSGRISYCWRLLLADEVIVDYVVIHEVCHRIHPDHSHAFWDTVGKYDTAYRVHRTWLKRFGHTLTLS